MIESVAVLGTGIIGGAIAANLAKSGFRVRAWNRSAGKVRALATSGVTVAESPSDAVRSADAVVTVLADGPAVESVLGGRTLADVPEGTLWLQMGTVGVRWNEKLVHLAADARLVFVDAPILGTRQPAEAGALVVLASGEGGDIERARPLFDAVASKVLHVGPVGGGQRLKLVVNNWVLGLVGVLAESIRVAEVLGVEPGSFLDAIEGTAVDAGYARRKGTSMIHDRHPPDGPLRIARKDVELILEAVGDEGLGLPMAEALGHLFALAEGAGHGESDMSAVYRALGERRTR